MQKDKGNSLKSKLQKKEKSLRESEKILSKLTNQENSDKKLLIFSIQKLREKIGFDEDISILGKRLYQILLENGLNESDTINPMRLLSKIEGFIYNKDYNMALELLEVIDSQEPCPHISESGERIYYVDNLIEAAIIWQTVLSTAPKKLNWTVSPRCKYLSLKTQILIDLKKFKEAENCANLILKLNPSSFDAYFLLAKIYENSKLEKFLKFLFEAYNVCYSSKNMSSFLKGVSKYYEMKKNLQVAYSAMYASSLYSDLLVVQNELSRLEVEINKMQFEKFSAPNMSKAQRMLQEKEIPFQIKDNIFKLVSKVYLDVLVEDYKNVELANFCKNAVDDIAKNASDLTKNIEKIAKKLRDEKKKKLDDEKKEE